MPLESGSGRMGQAGGSWSRGRLAAGIALVAALLAGFCIARRLWPHLEPARSTLLLPAMPWQQPPVVPRKGLNPLKKLTPGWQARLLGNPAAQRYPACWQSLPRTPWDLALFNGRLYVGLGNASNEGATANAGPVPLLAYHFSKGRWLREAKLPEEEISRFITHGDELWIPGADARGSWRWGNLYHRSGGEPLWWQERRLPRFIHLYDLVWHRGHMVVAGNVPDAVTSGPEDQRHGSALAISVNGGRGWHVQRLAGWRATALLALDGELYAVEALPGQALQRWLQRGKRWQQFTAVHQWLPDGRWQPRRDLTAQVLLPGVAGAGQRFAWIDQVTHAGSSVAWIAQLGPWRDQPSRREAFVVQRLSRERAEVQSIPLEAGSQAMDLHREGSNWLLLSSKQLSSERWRSQVTRVGLNGHHFQREELVAFEAPLPGWSLAGDQHRFFVGLGHPPQQAEPTPGTCSSADRLSGTVVSLQHN